MILMSIDALRGFDMWFIIGSAGGAGLIALICSALGMPDCALALQMHHVAWEGFRHHDTIFPLFLFLAGVSWPFSLASQLEKGRTMKQIHLKIIRTCIWRDFQAYSNLSNSKRSWIYRNILGDCRHYIHSCKKDFSTHRDNCHTPFWLLGDTLLHSCTWCAS